jgi:hypothetical protein
LGTGKGTSVLEMVASFEKASGKVKRKNFFLVHFAKPSSSCESIITCTSFLSWASIIFGHQSLGFVVGTCVTGAEFLIKCEYFLIYMSFESGVEVKCCLHIPYEDM